MSQTPTDLSERIDRLQPADVLAFIREHDLSPGLVARKARTTRQTFHNWRSGANGASPAVLNAVRQILSSELALSKSPQLSNEQTNFLKNEPATRHPSHRRTP